MMADVQKYRRRGRQSENVKAIQDAHGQRRQPDEKQIRKDDAVEGHGLVPVQVLGRSGNKRVNHGRREDHSQHGDDGQHQRQRPEQVVGKLPDFLGRLLAHVAREHRDEGGGHRAFAHQTTEKIGDAVGQNEGVGDMRGAQKQGVALVPDVSENAAKYRNERDDRGGFEYLLLFGQRAASPSLTPMKTIG